MGIDIGTSGCKAACFDDEGYLRSFAYREYRTSSPVAGWVELDSYEVINACVEVIREASLGSPTPVRALGISSQGEAFTPVDAAGHFLGNAMVSSDTRAAALVEPWSAQFGQERLYEITGHTAHPLFTLFKLAWLREQQPDIWAQTARFHCFEDLLHLRLGIEPAMSWPLAGRTMLFDVRRHSWSDEILDELGLRTTQLARPLASGSLVGTIPQAIAKELGFTEEVCVVAGGHDQSCAALGAGVVSAGMAMYATGTVECIAPALPEAVFSHDLLRNNLCTYDFTVPDMYTSVAYSLTGGNILKWFRDEFATPQVAEAERTGADVYDLILQQLPAQPSEVLVLPYFTPSGTPYFDADVTGAIFGLRLSTKRGDVLRALLEGVAFEMRLNLEVLQHSGIRINELRATGGGAKNPACMQLKADVLGKPITSVAVTEAGCLGAAMLAAAMHTHTTLATLVPRWVRPGPVYTPNPNYIEWYNKRFQQYTRLYPMLKQFAEE